MEVRCGGNDRSEDSDHDATSTPLVNLEPSKHRILKFFVARIPQDLYVVFSESCSGSHPM